MHLLLADENFDLGVVEALKNLGHDVITLYDINLGNIKYPDEEVLATATELGRCVLSFNRKDFIKLHKAGILHAGIIICTYNRDRVLLAGKIDAVLHEVGDTANKLLRIYRDKS